MEVVSIINLLWWRFCQWCVGGCGCYTMWLLSLPSECLIYLSKPLENNGWKNQLQNHKTISVFLKFTIIGIELKCFIHKIIGKNNGTAAHCVHVTVWQLSVAYTNRVEVLRARFPRMWNSCLARSKKHMAVRYAVSANNAREPLLRCRSGYFRFELNQSDKSNVALLVMVCTHFTCVLNRNRGQCTHFFIIGRLNCQPLKWPISVSYICEPCAAANGKL